MADGKVHSGTTVRSSPGAEDAADAADLTEPQPKGGGVKAKAAAAAAAGDLPPPRPDGLPPRPSLAWGSSIATALGLIDEAKLKERQAYTHLKNALVAAKDAQTYWRAANQVQSTLREVDLRTTQFAVDMASGGVNTLASGARMHFQAQRSQLDGGDGSGPAAQPASTGAHPGSGEPRPLATEAEATEHRTETSAAGWQRPVGDDAEPAPGEAAHAPGQAAPMAEEPPGGARGEEYGRLTRLITKLDDYSNQAQAWSVTPALQSEEEDIQSLKQSVEQAEKSDGTSNEGAEKALKEENSILSRTDNIRDIGTHMAHKTTFSGE